MLLRLLRTYLRPFRGLLAGVFLFQLIGTLATLYLPSLNADIIDQGVARGDTDRILSMGSWMLLVALVQVSATIAAVYCGAKVAMAFGREVRSAVFHRVGSFSAREVGQFGAPSLVTRNSNDVQQVQMLVLMSTTMMVMAPIMCIGGLVMALRQDLELSWLMLVSVPVLLVGVVLVVRRMVPQFRAMQDRIDTVNRILREQISGLRVVRAFVREEYEAIRFAAANEALTETALKAGRLMAVLFPYVMLVFNASSVAVLWFGGIRVDGGEMEVGALTAFLQYLMQILMSVMMASFMFVMLPRAAVSAERISEVLATTTSVESPRDPVTEVPARPELVFDRAAFSFPGAEEPVLRDITFTVRPGETTAIIGSTGAGKTTLLGLVPRLMDVTRGSVQLGGIDVRHLDPDVLRSRIGLVPQKAYLFSGTVASNLRYGHPEATEQEMWEALEIAQARDFVEAMSDGLWSPISQGGTNVSGGQRQRLSIARAIIRRPAMYLFDDSFSALDLTTDARLRAALRPHTRDAGVVVVAQRVSTIVDADQIVVLDDGAIVGIGRHQELKDTCPTYSEIVESQLTAEEAA